MTSGPTTGACGTCSRGCPRACRCWARRRPPTTAWSPTWSSSWAAGVKAYRGELGRDSLRFEVVELPGQADRLAWLATWLEQLPGSGIVYTLTKRDADVVAEWLTTRGIAAEAYSGEVETERRVDVEDRLLRNDLKAVVATSALGMGYDKPDLGFVVHYQAPGSVISYYQQVGPRRPRDRARGGRAAARRRGPPDPGLLHRAGVPAPRAGRARAGADRRSGRHHAGADRRGQPRPRPDRGDAEGAGRRGRGRPATARAGCATRASGPTTPSATRGSPSCAAASRRRWPPSARTGAA